MSDEQRRRAEAFWRWLDEEAQTLRVTQAGEAELLPVEPVGLSHYAAAQPKDDDDEQRQRR